MGEKPHRIFPHGMPERLGEGLWRVVGSLPFPLKRNMFIHRLTDSGLLLFSVVALDDAGMAAVEALGKPAVMVVPHVFHLMDAPFYQRRYPDLKVVAPADVAARIPQVRVHAAPDAALPPLGVNFHVIPGMKYTEVVLELPVDAGTALIFVDLVGQNEGPTGLMMKLLGPPKGRGVSRIVKFRQIADRSAVRAFLRTRAETPGLKLVAGCHGGVVTRDCAAWLRDAAQAL